MCLRDRECNRGAPGVAAFAPGAPEH
jgi:hypothetical protein